MAIDRSKIQLQIAAISGGGQIPIDEVGGTGGGVPSVNGITGAVTIQSPDGTIRVVPALNNIDLTIPFNPQSTVRYVAPAAKGGSPGNNGSILFPKETWQQAYESLPPTGGVIFIEDGSYWGKPTATSHITPIAKQGVRLTNFTDGGGNYWPGFAPLKPVITFGYGGTYSPFFNVPIAGINPGDPGDGPFPQDPSFDYGIWVAANNFPFAFYNVTTVGTHGAGMFGVNGTEGNDIYDPANRMAQTTAFHIENCSAYSAQLVADQQAQWNIGYSYFCDFVNINANCAIVEAIDSERRAGILVKGGTGSPDFVLNGYSGAQGGVIYKPGATSWRCQITGNMRIEGDFVNPLPPVVWLQALHGAGEATIPPLDQADGGPGSMKALKIDNAVSGQVIVDGMDPSRIDGICTLRGGPGTVDESVSVWPPRDTQTGIIRGTLWGPSYGPAFNTAISASPRRNLSPQHQDLGGETGPLTPVPINPSANSVYTASNATGPHGVATPVEDRWGGFTGFKLETNDAATATCDLFAANRAVNPGDSFYCSFWAKIAAGAGDGIAPAVMSVSGGVVTGSAFYGTDNNGALGVKFVGEDGVWQQYAGIIHILTTSGPGRTDFFVHLQANPNHAVTICGVRIEQLSAADGLMEATSLMQFGAPTWQTPVGSISTPPDAQLIAGSITSTKATPAVGQAPGKLLQIEPVYSLDTPPVLVGYRPIYAAPGGQSVADKFKTIAAAVLGDNFAFDFDELNGLVDDKWGATGGVAKSTTYPTAYEVDGVAGHMFESPQVVNLRTQKWFFGGVAKFSGALAAGDLCGFNLETGPGGLTDGFFMGKGFVASPTKFSMTVLDASNAKLVASTVDYDTTQAHIFYAWSDGTQVKFSVDFEPEILVTNNMAGDVPNVSAVFQEMANMLVSGANPIEFGAACFAHSL
jgi:hypothetical protein